jgi:hypothetical protein
MTTYNVAINLGKSAAPLTRVQIAANYTSEVSNDEDLVIAESDKEINDASLLI